MCLDTRQGEALIAKEDITVYKRCILNDIDDDGVRFSLHAVCVNHRYSKTETAPLRIQKVYDGFEISSGLHANKGLRGWNENNTSWIIPKGSSYYENYHEIVSNCLIFNEFIGDIKHIDINKVKWAKPSIKRFIIKWKRYFSAAY